MICTVYFETKTLAVHVCCSKEMAERWPDYSAAEISVLMDRTSEGGG